MSENLKPCPHCPSGGDSVICEPGGEVMCWECQATAPDVETWNTRAREAELEAEANAWRIKCKDKAFSEREARGQVEQLEARVKLLEGLLEEWYHYPEYGAASGKNLPLFDKTLKAISGDGNGERK